jgi:hypothetical protein
MEKIDFYKKVKGISTYKNSIDTEFHEFITTPSVIESSPFTVSQFFSYYDQLFYDIPISGDNSHATLVQRSRQYIGGSSEDPEKLALIDEINSLRQQLIDLSETYLNISSITS